MTDRYETLRDGKWVDTPARRYRIGCCDCGLVHDVEFRINPHKYSFKEKIRQNLVTALNVRRAKKIFTISEFSKTEIMKAYKLPAEKIQIIFYLRVVVSADNRDCSLPARRRQVINGFYLVRCHSYWFFC